LNFESRRQPGGGLDDGALHTLIGGGGSRENVNEHEKEYKHEKKLNGILRAAVNQ
jgi:hypothetical protein